MSTVTHLLLLPEGTTAQTVESLIMMRYPHAVREQEHVLRVSPNIVSFGALHDVIPGWVGQSADFHQPITGVKLTESLGRALSVLPGDAAQTRPVVCTLTTLASRGDRLPEGMHDPDGLDAVFPDGYPTGPEEETLTLAVAIARRLGGAVSCAETGAVVVPDPQARVNLTVFSAYWLAPIELQQAVRTVYPHVTLATDAHAWVGPSVEARTQRAANPRFMLSADQQRDVHQAADAFDHAAMSRPDELDAYAMNVPVGAGGEFGVVEVRAAGEEVVPPVLAGLDWARQAVSYAMVWGAPDDTELAKAHPGTSHRVARRQAQHLIAQLTAAVHKTATGVIVDSDGFVVDPHLLPG